ncbi:MAG: 2Fe-2S iron-sulfur cluster binding domain-containing protein [Deltaproteobacteria bacterium]|nr:2Fe-2S iron-sulfur cluster binding domain-containing protein [Deltaproteobacteria bacterium]
MNNKVKINIDGKEIQAEAGSSLLQAALDNDIYIPHLCYLDGMKEPHAGCRLCFVEVKGLPGPVTSCTTKVEDNMVVRTHSPDVDRLVKHAYELIISTHPIVCKTCPANRSCALQDMAKELRLPLKPGKLNKILPDYPIDDSHPLFILDPNLCVLCGKCVFVCNEVEGARALEFLFRGISMRIGTAAGLPLAESTCTGCLKCVDVCPVGALSRKANQVQAG